MTRLRAAVHDPPVSPLALVGLGAAGVYLLGLGWAMANTSYDIWGALVIGPVLVALTIPLAGRVARQEGDSRMAHLIVAALVLKLLASLVRYQVAFEVYGGVADADRYHDWGVLLAPMFRHGDFTVDLGQGVVGTGFMQVLTGIVYTVTGPTRLGGFLVFAWIGFWGLYFFYRAFRIGFPDGDHRRYALLLFFLPSLLFWPSSIGKEAWMCFTLGLTAYGCARILAHRRAGFVLLALGLVGTSMVRPHVTLIVFFALAFGYLLRRPARPSLLSPASKAVGIVVLALAGVIVLSQVETFFGVDRLDQQSLDQVLTRTTEQSTQQDSQFEAIRPGSPVGLANAALAVLFRPWPTEAHNPQALIAALEGSTILVLTALSLRRLAAIPSRMRRTPYVALALAFTLLFIYTFASFGNFGNIVRQRTQVFPFLFVLLAIPLPGAGKESSEDAPPVTAGAGAP